MNQAPPKRTCRKFDKTFKREAVQNWLSSGKSADVIAGELGINPPPQPTRSNVPIALEKNPLTR
jgi:hypothetical protein